MSLFLFFLYDFIFSICFFFYLPIYIWRRKITVAAFKEKIGRIPVSYATTPASSIWIQVVSVGEANLVGTLCKELKDISNSPLVISTTTLTGNRVAKKKYTSLAKIIFFPFDISLILRRAVQHINPQLFIAVETELWPNLFYRLTKHRIPIVIVNGRISQKAYRRYRLIKPIMKKILAMCDYIGVQNQYYKETFLSLGAPEDKIVISGNMKFESITPNPTRLNQIKNKYLPIVKTGNRPLLIAGSTHHPEEEIILNTYKELLSLNSHLNLIIAPRHIERTAPIEKMVLSRGFTSFRLSRPDTPLSSGPTVFLLDTVGDLLYFYALADICFVGGSLSNHGGHNILEPIYFLKPTCFGPSMDNFKDIEEAVLEEGAGFRVTSAQELKKLFIGFLTDDALRQNVRSKCRGVFEKEKESLKKNLEMIRKCLYQINR